MAEANELHHVLRMMTGWGQERIERFAAKVKPDESQELIAAYQSRKAARGVLQRIGDRIADELTTAAKPSPTVKRTKANPEKHAE